MKTTRLIVALSLALIFATGYTALGGQPEKKSLMPNNHANGVTYVVKIALSDHIARQSGPFQIILTDVSGKMVAPARTFVTGTEEYTFYEAGSVTGTRIAKMINLDPNPKHYVIRPCIKTGTFLRGHTYVFPILPLPYAGEAETTIR